MASSSSRPERTYVQDYLARIRYSNNLPPPPMPPKFLDIPGTGLAGGQYTSAGFASRLAREQPLNIEADAELGMPIDLIGLPGVFDGDESAIHFKDNPGPIDPRDRALLRPLSTLGKPASISAGVSFLRRTEYISALQGTSRYESTTSKDLLRPKAGPKRKKQPDVSKDDPVNILRGIVKGFDIAHPEDKYTGPDTDANIRGAEITPEEQDAWDHPRHPTNPDLTLLDSYPILPDLEAVPEAGAYVITKFHTNPVAESDRYDERLDVAILRPMHLDAEQQALMDAQMAEHEANPSVPAPVPNYEYEFFLPAAAGSVPNIRRRWDVRDPAADDPALYDSENRDTGNRFFRYDRVRAYETTVQTGDRQDPHGDTVVLALHDLGGADAANDGDEEDDEEEGTEGSPRPRRRRRLQKAGYYYPVVQRLYIRPRRAHGVGGRAGQPVNPDEERIDYMEAAVHGPTAEDLDVLRGHVEKYDPEA